MDDELVGALRAVVERYGRQATTDPVGGWLFGRGRTQDELEQLLVEDGTG